MKLTYTIAALAITCFTVGFAILQYGKSREKEGYQKAINLRINSDNQALIHQAQVMVTAYESVAQNLSDLRKTPDPSSAPASIQSTVVSLCDYRKSKGVPCVSPRPSTKPDVK